MPYTETVEHTSGWTLYDVFILDDQVYDGTTTLVDRDTADWSDVETAGLRSEIGSTGVYSAPSDLSNLPNGTYRHEVRRKIGATASDDDDPVVDEDEEFEWFDQDVVGSEDLTTTARYKTFAGITASTWDTAIGYLVTAASLALLKYCDRTSFKSTTYTDEIYNGNGHRFLVLRNTPVTSITNIKIHRDSTADSTTYSGSEFIYESKTGEVRFDPDATSTECFARGFQNISATYVAGEAVPADLELACWLVVKHYFSQSQVNPTIKSEKIGDYAYTNFDATQMSAEISSDPAFERIRAILTSGGYYRPHWN